VGVAVGQKARARNDVLEALFHAQRRRLWGLAYRITGTAQDADDIVQEAFTRLLERGSGDNEDLGPWLARVATNLSIDALRRRRRRAYVGPWLPTPVEATDEDWLEGHASDRPNPEARYSLVESSTYAFLLALEALGPRQRAILLLRDVLGCSVRETAALVAASETNVRVLHLRARRALEGYDQSRRVPTPELRERYRATLEAFLGSLLAQDVRGVEELLAESVRTVTDAGGEYTALVTPLVGRARVARFFLTAALHRRAGDPRVVIRQVNALPAAVITLARPVRRQAPLTVLRCELDKEGRISVVHGILASRKLGVIHVA
jgi:RNA polymerase sigma-70 factor (ECF subfamily)